jgi:hypothetical protein
MSTLTTRALTFKPPARIGKVSTSTILAAASIFVVAVLPFF